MGLMEYDDFTTELGFLLGNRNDPDTTNASRLSRWVNQAYTYMCHPSVHHFREMQKIGSNTLSAGNNDYDINTIDSGVVTVASRWFTYIEGTTIFDPTNKRQPLHPRSIRWLEERTSPSGRPRFYIIDGFTVFFYPTPGSAENGNVVKIGYTREPAVISGTDTTVVSSYFDRPLLKFAQAFAEADLGDRAKSLITLKEAQGLLNNAIPETELEAEDYGFKTPIILQPAMGF